MSDMLKAGLIRSLASAPIARAQAPRDPRTESGFGAQLDAARDSIRENREMARNRRNESRDKNDAVDDADAPKESPEDRNTPAADSQESAASLNQVTAPIVVVTIAGPMAPVAEGPALPEVEKPVVQDEAAAPRNGAPSEQAPDVAESQSPRVSTSTSSLDAILRTAEPVAVASLPAQVDVANDHVETPNSEQNSSVSQRVTADIDTGNEQAAQEDVFVAIGSRATKLARTSAVSDESIQTALLIETQDGRQSSSRDESVDPSPTQPEGETLRDVRVGDALQRALHGETRRHPGEGASKHGAPQEQAAFELSPQVASLGRASTNQAEAASLEPIARATGAEVTNGDPSAATIGKFLAGISTSIDPVKATGRDVDDATSRSHQHSSPTQELSGAAASTGGGAKTGSARPVTPAGATFGQILATRLDSPASLDSAARLLAANGGTGRHQVILRLSPAELGELRLDIRMEAGAMTLRVDADNAAAGRLIESRLGELREALAGHGISIERADVVARGDASANGGFEHRSASDDPSSRQQSAHGDTREGTWNFNEGQASNGGDRSSQSDANPWSMRSTMGEFEVNAPANKHPTDARAVMATLQNGSLDLVA